MKMTTVAVAIGAVILMASAVKAEPQVLTPSQMDQVTAAGADMAVTALAGASGDFSASTFTDTRTKVVSGPWHEVGVGIGVARSLACCGDANEVEVATWGGEAGDNVWSVTHRMKLQSGLFAHAISVTTTVIIWRAPAEEIFRILADIELLRPAQR
jgi:hypothetical protein